jgi:hypothetical protein
LRNIRQARMSFIVSVVGLVAALDLGHESIAGGDAGIRR